ncbi:MAG TPA: hypothetical protein VFK94_03955, partial [Patescibacteria group bacterium]|nr:hypothetical protein [Patescibacteria group bacterium]
MKADKKEQRRREQLAALFGMEEPPQLTGPTRKQRAADASREAEAVLKYIERPTTFTEHSCRECGKDFAVNRANVAYCS